MDLRKGGAPRTGSKQLLSLTGPFAELGETQVSGDQIAALRALYHQNPSMQAARSILIGQLLSSGISVRRKGEDGIAQPPLAGRGTLSIKLVPVIKSPKSDEIGRDDRDEDRARLPSPRIRIEEGERACVREEFFFAQ